MSYKNKNRGKSKTAHQKPVVRPHERTSERTKERAKGRDKASASHTHAPKENRPVLYGFHAVEQAWLNPDRSIHALYLTEQVQSGFENTRLAAERKGLPRPDPVIIEKKKLDKLLPTGAVHQGIALACSALEEFSAQDFIIRAQSKARTVLLMLDQVTDPHNVGAILRSACAFGADGVIMQRKHAPELGGVLAKTACGAVDHMPVAFETNLSRAIEEFKEDGFFVYGLDEHSDKVIGQMGRPSNGEREKIILVLGSEGDGIRRLVKAHCDELVKLPTSGPVASLNVSNAAAIALYAVLAP